MYKEVNITFFNMYLIACSLLCVLLLIVFLIVNAFYIFQRKHKQVEHRALTSDEVRLFMLLCDY